MHLDLQLKQTLMIIFIWFFLYDDRSHFSRWTELMTRALKLTTWELGNLVSNFAVNAKFVIFLLGLFAVYL